MQNSATLSEILLVQGFSFPIMFLSVIVVLLFKCYKIRISKLLQIGVVVFVVYYISLFGFGVFENKEFSERFLLKRTSLEQNIYTLLKKKKELLLLK